MRLRKEGRKHSDIRNGRTDRKRKKDLIKDTMEGGIMNRVRKKISRSNSSTFQALLRVIFKIFQHLIAGVKYVSKGIYILRNFFFTFYHNYVHCIML